jgi:hypothetical protein
VFLKLLPYFRADLGDGHVQGVHGLDLGTLEIELLSFILFWCSVFNSFTYSSQPFSVGFQDSAPRIRPIDCYRTGSVFLLPGNNSRATGFGERTGSRPLRQVGGINGHFARFGARMGARQGDQDRGTKRCGCLRIDVEIIRLGSGAAGSSADLLDSTSSTTQ